jgi:RNA polymerase sigma-70 factor (ECF subfamily)
MFRGVRCPRPPNGLNCRRAVAKNGRFAAYRTLSGNPASNKQHVTRLAIALKTNQVSEPEIIGRVLAGDRFAARELYDAHAPRVYRLAFRLTGDADLAREFTQDTFVRAFSQLARFRGDSALSTWLHRITVTVVANAMRKVKRFRERETDLEDVHPISSDGAGVDPVLRERLARAIDGLSEIYRTTIIMHDIEGYTHTEIADVLGVAEGTCKSRLSQARAQLRAALADLAPELES